MNVIDNPAELVTAYFTGGDPAVAMLIKQKIQKKALIWKNRFRGPAGRVQRHCSNLGAPLEP